MEAGDYVTPPIQEVGHDQIQFQLIEVTDDNNGEVQIFVMTVQTSPAILAPL